MRASCEGHSFLRNVDFILETISEFASHIPGKAIREAAVKDKEM